MNYYGFFITYQKGRFTLANSSKSAYSSFARLFADFAERRKTWNVLYDRRFLAPSLSEIPSYSAETLPGMRAYDVFIDFDEEVDLVTLLKFLEFMDKGVYEPS